MFFIEIRRVPFCKIYFFSSGAITKILKKQNSCFLLVIIFVLSLSVFNPLWWLDPSLKIISTAIIFVFLNFITEFVSKKVIKLKLPLFNYRCLKNLSASLFPVILTCDAETEALTSTNRNLAL